MFRVERGREKLCRCKKPKYEIDTVNRIVMCTRCGSITDPFDALLNLSQNWERYEEYQETALKKCRVYGEMADKELRRRFRNKIFKDLEKQYFQGLLPHCPNCDELIDPVKMT